MTKRTKAPSARKADTANDGSLIMSHHHLSTVFSGMSDIQKRHIFGRLIDLGETLEQIRTRLRGAA